MASNRATESESAELERARQELDRDMLRQQANKVNLKDDFVPESFEAALAGLEAAGISVESSSDLVTDEFPLIDKAELVNKRFIMLTWHLSRPENEDFGTPYFLVRGIDESGRRFRFVDGSTGIASQLMKLTTMRVDSDHPSPNAGLVCEKGLTVSEYNTTDAGGNAIRAKTYYIASS